MKPYDLADLDAFTAVASARSFRGAAALRGVSPSALSEAVRRLEASLDVRLLNRTTRSVTPTAAGQTLLDRLKPAFGEVNEAVDAIARDAKGEGGTLRLNVPSAVADLVLPSIVVRFMAAHPAITLDITAENNFVDVLAEGFDAGVRYDERLERDMIAIPIGPRTQRFVTAASPAYLTTHGTPKHPQDLLAHNCIRFRFSSGVTYVWEFERDGHVIKITPNGRLISNRIELQISAAVAGLGVVRTFEGFLNPALVSGALVEILPDWSEIFSGPYLYYASRRQMPGPLRAFVDFVKADYRMIAT
jgi:DNA-binding transcriptional LysR family regulator